VSPDGRGAHAAELGGDPDRVAVGGDSAGGNLAALCAQHVEGLVHQLLVYPPPTTTSSFDSVRSQGEGYLLTGLDHGMVLDNYLGDGDRKDPKASPLLATDELVATTPCAHVLTPATTRCADEGEAYAARLAQVGVTTVYRCYEGQMHGFFSLPVSSRSPKRPRGSNPRAAPVVPSRPRLSADTASARRPPGDPSLHHRNPRLARAAEVPWHETRQKSPSAGLIERVAHGEKTGS